MTISNITSADVEKITASARKRAREPVNRIRIEGEYLSAREIAERIGISESVAGRRLAMLRGASGPITWDRLRAFTKNGGAP